MTEGFPVFAKVDYWDEYRVQWMRGHGGIRLVNPEKYHKDLLKRDVVAQVIDLDNDISYPLGMERCLLTGRLEEKCTLKETVMGKKGKNQAEIDDTEALESSGKTILELSRDRLDEYIDELMDEDAMANLKGKEKEKIKGTADGIAQVIALIEKPYAPDVDAVKEKAMERWEVRNS